MRRFRPRRSRCLGVAVLAGGIVLGSGAVASADRLGPITFEPVPSTPPYTLGNINGQQGWMKTGGYDAAVAAVAGFPDAARYRFGAQALRISDALASGSFGDQTISPGLASPAGEGLANTHFEAKFKIGTTKRTVQPGLQVSISPDDGNGSRMSYLRFNDLPDGVHVFFDDVTNPGGLGAPSTFNETDIATLKRRKAHAIKFSLDLKPGAANDVVKIYIDGKLKIRGTTWEDYYRYDPEQSGNGNQVPSVGKLIFPVRRSAADSHPANADQGYLIDRVSLLSSNPPRSKADCKRKAWKTHTREDGSAFKNQGACIRYVKERAHERGHEGSHRDGRHDRHHRRPPH
jgi:hypothetical protein